MVGKILYNPHRTLLIFSFVTFRLSRHLPLQQRCFVCIYKFHTYQQNKNTTSKPMNFQHQENKRFFGTVAMHPRTGDLRYNGRYYPRCRAHYGKKHVVPHTQGIACDCTKGCCFGKSTECTWSRWQVRTAAAVQARLSSTTLSLRVSTVKYYLPNVLSATGDVVEPHPVAPLSHQMRLNLLATYQAYSLPDEVSGLYLNRVLPKSKLGQVVVVPAPIL